MSCAGHGYIFGLYSGAIKSALQYDQETLDTLGFFKDLGGTVGILSGLLNEVTPAWFVVGVGAVTNLFGYLMIWLAVTGHIAKPPIWQMYVYMCLGANSQTFTNTGVMVTCVKNFPQSRGIVIGMLKGFVGLSGAILTQLYHAIYGQDPNALILFIAWFPAAISLCFMFFIRPKKALGDANEKRMFYKFLGLALVLASFLMVVIVVETRVKLSRVLDEVAGAVTALLIVLHMVFAIHCELGNIRSKDTTETKHLHLSASKRLSRRCLSIVMKGAMDFRKEDSEIGKLANQPHSLSSGSAKILPVSTMDMVVHSEVNAKENAHQQEARGSGADNKFESPDDPGEKSGCCCLKRPKRGDDFTIPQALMSMDMWILFIATTCGVGAAITAVDNMGQIGDSQGYSKVTIGTCVSLLSIWNFLGRVMSGFLSETLLRRYRFPRPLMMTMILALASIGHILIAVGFPGSLYIASVVLGLCFGAHWTILFTVISELFGLRYFATLYNIGAVASPVGMYILSVKVAGYLYDKEARMQAANLLLLHLQNSTMPVTPASMHHPAVALTNDLTCNGPTCFRLTFFVMAAVSLFASLISAVLVWRTRNFYRQDIYARFSVQDEQKYS